MEGEDGVLVLVNGMVLTSSVLDFFAAGCGGVRVQSEDCSRQLVCGRCAGD